MKHGTYIGPDPQLKGERALLRKGRREGEVLVQFDNFSAQVENTPLAFGWTAFPEASFSIDEDDQ